MKTSNIYRNGTYIVNVNSYGTKTYKGREFIAEFPDSLDIKITEQCQHKCPFCHEMSKLTGKHGDLKELLFKLKGLPEGVELAIGGGNALLHPELEDFLKQIKDHFRVALTVHWKDIIDESSRNKIKNLEETGLINSLGISIADTKLNELKDATENNKELMDFLPRSSYETPVVFHIIPGVTKTKTFRKLLWDSFHFSKILILGFKQFGRASKKDLPEKEFKEWKELIREFQRTAGEFVRMNKTIAFDNLAIEQLEVKEIFSEDYWNEHYLGDEFTHSMYVDACKREYGQTSRSPYSERKSWDDYETVIDYFKNNKV